MFEKKHNFVKLMYYSSTKTNDQMFAFFSSFSNSTKNVDNNYQALKKKQNIHINFFSVIIYKEESSNTTWEYENVPNDNINVKQGVRLFLVFSFILLQCRKNNTIICQPTFFFLSNDYYSCFIKEALWYGE